MKPKERQQTGKPAARSESALGDEIPAARDDVHLAANRCPYCHEGVSVDEDRWVSCRQCQARHHSGCWEELAHCGSCRGTRFLAEATGETPGEIVEEIAIEDPGTHKIGTIAAVLCSAVVVAVYFALTMNVLVGTDYLIAFALIGACLVMGLIGKLRRTP